MSQEAAHLDASGVGEEGNPDRLAGLLLKRLGFFLPEAAMTGLGEQSRQFLEVEIGEFMGRNGFLEQGA